MCSYHSHHTAHLSSTTSKCTSAKKTCGSTVFSTGHPRQYSLAPAMLVCADRTRRGMFIAVWPQMRFTLNDSYIYRWLRLSSFNFKQP